MFKKIFGKRPRRSLTVQESLVELLLLGVYVGLIAGMFGWVVRDKLINGYGPQLASLAEIALVVMFLALVSWATFLYFRRTEQRLVLADSIRTDDDEDEFAQRDMPASGAPNVAARFKKIFSKRPRRSLTVREYMAELLLVGVFVGYVACLLFGLAVIDWPINAYKPYLASLAEITLVVALLALVGSVTVRYFRRTELRLVLADSVRTEIAIEDEGDHE